MRLVWGVKSSLLGYIRGMADGEILLDQVTEEPGGFAFPDNDDLEDGVLRFRGAVTLVAHGGMMNVTLRDPAVTPDGDEWVLSIADPDDPAVRLSFARMKSFIEDGDDLRGTGSALTADGADLFFGPYGPGTPVDDPVIRP